MTPPGRRRPGRHLQTAFIVGEVAVAVVLVVGSGLFVASFIRLMRVDLGFDHRGVAAIPLSPHRPVKRASQERNAFPGRALLTAGIERLRAVRVLNRQPRCRGTSPHHELDTLSNRGARPRLQGRRHG